MTDLADANISLTGNESEPGATTHSRTQSGRNPAVAAPTQSQATAAVVTTTQPLPIKSSPPSRIRTSTSASMPATAASASASSSPPTNATAGQLHKRHSKGSKTAPIPLTCTQKSRDVVCSLRLLLPLLLAIAIVVVTVVSWKLTYDASQSSINLVTTNFGDVLLSQVTAQMKQQLLSAELITNINAGYFREGILDPFTRRDEMYHVFNTQIGQTVKSGTCSSIDITLKSGPLLGYGYYFPDGQAPYEAYWNGSDTGDGINAANSEYFTDGNGHPTVLTNVLGNYNLTLSTTPWWTAVNISDPHSCGWTEPFFLGEWFQTNSRVIQNTNGDILGVTSIDFNLAVIDTFTKSIAQNSVGSDFFILNAQSGALLGTSYDSFSLSDTSDATNPTSVYMFSSVSTDLMKAIHEFILSSTGRVADATHPPESLYDNLPSLQGTINVDGRSKLVTINAFKHAPEPTTLGGPSIGPNGQVLLPTFTPEQLSWANDHDVQWVFIHVLDRSSIVSAINDSNVKVLIIVICIAVSLVILMCAWGIYSMNLLLGLSSLLTSFANFEFSEHVAQGKLKSPSVFTELRIMQDSVLLMTRAFKNHLESQKKIFGNTNTSSSSSHGGGADTIMKSQSSTGTTSPGQMTKRALPLAATRSSIMAAAAAATSTSSASSPGPSDNTRLLPLLSPLPASPSKPITNNLNLPINTTTDHHTQSAGGSADPKSDVELAPVTLHTVRITLDPSTLPSPALAAVPPSVISPVEEPTLTTPLAAQETDVTYTTADDADTSTARLT